MILAVSIHSTKITSDEELAAQIVRDVLCSTRDNVNFIHEIYRQAFLLNFSHSLAIRKAITVYKDLIQFSMPELPTYILEPPEEALRSDESHLESNKPNRLRNDSYIGAIHKENLIVRAGLQVLINLSFIILILFIPFNFLECSSSFHDTCS